MKIAAAAILLLAVFNLDATITLTGSHYTLRNVLKAGYCVVSYCQTPTVFDAVTEQTIEISSSGYSPNYFAVEAGKEVTLHLENKGAINCAQAFTIPALHIQKLVQPNKSVDIVFTAPEKPGKITFTCSMGMYPGTIEVL